MADTFKERCTTRTTLLAAWLNAMDVYSRAVAEQSLPIGVVPKAEYERLVRAAEDARYHAVGARQILEAHVSSHGCDRSKAAA
jgi:hypothetical protein